MTKPVLGIDLGTTNTVVSFADDSGVHVLADEAGATLLPSVVAFLPGGRVAVGAEAKERRISDPRNAIHSTKRLIGRPFESVEVTAARQRFPFELTASPTGGVVVRARGETYTLPEIGAFVLREALRVAELRLGQSSAQAVVTVPANFNELQRTGTKAAGRIAGIEVLRTLNEPTAAALAFGMDARASGRVVVFDLGGGTFDVSILELAGEVIEVIATAGDTYLGGDDVDRLVCDQLVDTFQRERGLDLREHLHGFARLHAASEWAKCQLSFQEIVDVSLREIVHASDGTPLHLHARLDRARLEATIDPLVRRTLSVCDEALRIAGITPSQIDDVLLVGGSTRIPLVRRRVAEHFGRPPLADVDPDLVVARGAALQARALTTPRGRSMVVMPELPLPLPGLPFALGLPSTDALPPPVPGSTAPAPRGPLLVDVTPLSLGVETVGGFCDVVIPRNAPVPLEETRIFTTAHDRQESVRIRVCQGESRRMAENQLLGELELRGLHPMPRGRIEVQVTFVLDADGTLSVQARDVQTGHSQEIRIRLIGEIGDEAIDALRRKQDALFGTRS